MLGVAEDDAEFIILSEPKAGLFGRVRGEARVQARVRPVAPPPKRGRRQRSERARNGSSKKGESKQASSGGDPRPSSAGSVAVAEGDRTDGTANVGGDPDRGDSDQASDSGGSRRSGNYRGSRNGGGGGGRGARQKDQLSSGRAPAEKEEAMEESLTLEQQGEAAAEFLSGLIREFGLDADVGYTELDEETVQVAATGDDLGLLVGPRGATLAAVQDLTRTFVQRQSENRTDRILVDVGGYREKRAAALKRFTEGIVAEVISSGEERALEPMSPADRKVVHDTVNEIEGVETISAGTEPSRYVVIQPSS
jgi:spoIIIJ-associated protein